MINYATTGLEKLVDENEQRTTEIKNRIDAHEKSEQEVLKDVISSLNSIKVAAMPLLGGLLIVEFGRFLLELATMFM